MRTMEEALSACSSASCATDDATPDYDLDPIYAND